MPEEAVKILATNRKAFHEYFVEDRFECGIELKGTEVKSFRAGAVSFPDAFAVIEAGQCWLQNLHVSEYPCSSIFNHDPDRKRRLLLHKAEILKLARKVDEKGFTLIPLRFYLKRGRVKVEIGLCKGKKQYDKRTDIKDRANSREIAREMRDRNA